MTETVNILLPIAGLAQRFVDRGYQDPKPLLKINGVPMIKMALDSLIKPTTTINYRLIFVIRKEHELKHNISDRLTRLFPDYETNFVEVDKLTEGTLCSCLLAKDLINTDDPLLVYTPDVCFETKFETQTDFLATNADGMVLTFKANSKDHSYVATDSFGMATSVAEKVVISNDALVGVYGFRSGKMFVNCAQEAIARNIRVNGEFYLAPIYNILIEEKKQIRTYRTDKMYVLGTPQDLEFYQTHINRFRGTIELAICCDHSGFTLKEKLLAAISGKFNYRDFGAYSGGDSDHYDYLKPCAEYVLSNSSTIGISICSTGQGFNIAANKIAGIRSALVTDAYTAEMGRRHNAANFFCLPAKVLDGDDLGSIVEAIVNNSFDGGRHSTRISRFENDEFFIK